MDADSSRDVGKEQWMEMEIVVASGDGGTNMNFQHVDCSSLDSGNRKCLLPSTS